MSVTSALAAVRAAQDPVVEVLCHHRDPAAGPGGRLCVRLTGCVGEVDEAFLAELLAAGAQRVIVRVEGCAGGAAAVVAGLEELVVIDPVEKAWSGLWKRRVVVDAEARRVSRRVLVNPLGAVDEVLPAEPDDELGVRQRLRTALVTLAEQGRWTPPDSRAGGVTMDVDGCRARGMCALACPEQAVTLDRADSVARLSFDPGLCTQCGECVRLCDASAITIGGEARVWDVAYASPAVVAEVRVATCARCGGAFSPEGDEQLCPVCAFRRANPFGSAAPPAPPTMRGQRGGSDAQR